MKEKTISLADLAIHILLRWRSIVVMLFLGGIFLGVFSFVRSSQNAAPQTQDESEALKDNMDLKEAIQRFLADEDIDLEAVVKEHPNADIEQYIKMLKAGLEDKLAEALQNNIEYLLYYEDLYRGREDYGKESILMRIDPDKACKAEATFLISSEDLESAYNFERVYEDIAFSPELLEEMAIQAETNSFYINEIYTLSRGFGGKMAGSDTFRVTIVHYDEAMCQTLLQTVINYIDARHEEIGETWGPHEVMVLNRSTGTVTDRNILNAQYEALASRLSLKTSITNIKAAFSDQEWYYYNLLAKGEIAGNPRDKLQATEEESESLLAGNDRKAPVVSVKYAAGGALLAAFLYVFVIFLIYIMNNKLRATDRLDDLYDIPQLGLISYNESRKKLLGFVDRWILSIQYRNRRRFSEDEALKLAASSIKMAAQKRSLDAVYLVGSELKEKALEGCHRIRGILAEDKISTHILGNVLYDAAAMEKLSEAKGIVLVEKAETALYTEIAEELELFRRQGIEVLGGIVVE